MDHGVVLHLVVELKSLPGLGVGEDVHRRLDVEHPLPGENLVSSHPEEFEVAVALEAEIVQLPHEVEDIPAGSVGACDVEEWQFIGADLFAAEENDGMWTEFVLGVVDVQSISTVRVWMLGKTLVIRGMALVRSVKV